MVTRDYTYELNNLKKDSDVDTSKIKKKSTVSEVFSALVSGKDLSKFDAKYADACVNYIKKLGERADNGDVIAVAELNTLRRFTIEAPVLEELTFLNIFGEHTQLGFDETPEREIWDYVGDAAREQASNGDVVFPAITKETYPVPTFTISGGYAVDYRRVANGDFSKENKGIQMVTTTIRNKAVSAVISRVYNAIKNASGIKYKVEASGLTKTAIDSELAKMRRFGKVSVVADYAILSQFSAWAGYTGSINNTAITGISQKVLDELAANGILSLYNGTVLSELLNPYDTHSLNADGTNFKTMLPAGLGFIIPFGVDSPIATFTRGGVTSFTGNNVKNGKVETRFDLELGVDVAKGQEYKIGTIYDNTIGGL